MNNFLAIFIGGGLGSLARYGISIITPKFFSGSFPLATLLSNIFSCIILGLILSMSDEKLSEQPLLKPLIIIGFCGGFSTFSTFSLENMEMMRAGNYLWTALNILVSIVTCMGLLFVLVKK